MHVRKSFTDIVTLVGLLTVPPVSYLITVLNREQVAQVRGHPIYVITDVTLIPLSSQSEARQAISQAKESLKKFSQHQTLCPESETSDDDENHDEAFQTDHDDQASPVSSDSSALVDPSASRRFGLARNTSSVAEDVIGRKGLYGRFAERWFWKMGWTTEKQKAQGMSVDGVERPRTSSGQATNLDDPQSKPSSAATTLDDTSSSNRKSGPETLSQVGEDDRLGTQAAKVTNTLLPKLLRTTRMLLGSRNFFFSYEIDITRRLGTNDKKGLPLHKSVDPLVSQPFNLICKRGAPRLTISPSFFGIDIY